MPISYEIDNERAIVFTTWRGDVTAEMLAQHYRRLLSDPAALAIHRSLVDLRDANILLTGNQLQETVETIAAPRLRGKQWKTAILVAKPVQRGVSAQYRVFAHSYSDDCIFEQYDEALTWLMSK